MVSLPMILNDPKLIPDGHDEGHMTQTHFYRATLCYAMRRYVRYMLSSCVCLVVRPSVCLSATSRSSTKMA